MARQMVTFDWCDPCLIESDGEMKEAAVESIPITIGNWKPRELMVCERHQKEWVTPLRDLLSELPTYEPTPQGRPMAGETKGNQVQCAVCERLLKNRSSLGSHVRNSHEITLAEYRVKYEQGQPEPTGDDDQGELPLTQDDLVSRTCEECGKEYTAVPSRINQVMGVHMAKTHKIPGKVGSSGRKRAKATA